MLGTAVRADVTVSFECAKWGHLLNDGLDMCGDLRVYPIGIPHHMLPVDALREFENQDFEAFLPRRRRNSHKGIYGNLLLIAGSVGMAGACILAAGAAMRSGVGLISVACPASIVPIVQQAAPCATCLSLKEERGAISREAIPELERAIKGKDALAVGPGLSTRTAPQVVEWALKTGLPAVLDADALNLISQDPDLKALLRPHHVITPHPGEAARLLGRAMGDPVADVRALRDLGPVALLKGASSLICGDKITLSAQGSVGMASGGSGDVLTGVIAALMAQGMPPMDAARVGAFYHGRAGETAQAVLGARAVTAMDVLDRLRIE